MPAVTALELLNSSQPLFAILDAARDERIYELVKDCKEPIESLYDGDKAIELDTVAPYLVRLKSGCDFLKTIIAEGWGNSWGVYLTSQLPLPDVRKHLRHFLTVEQKGERVLFRFYDPRVLRVFLPVCNPGEIKEFFGPIERFICEGKDPKMAWRPSPSAIGLVENVVELKAE
jgi:hypothetical protein